MFHYLSFLKQIYLRDVLLRPILAQKPFLYNSKKQNYSMAPLLSIYFLNSILYYYYYNTIKLKLKGSYK